MEKQIILPPLVVPTSSKLSKERLRAINFLADNIDQINNCCHDDLTKINMNYIDTVAFSSTKFRMTKFYGDTYGIEWKKSGHKSNILYNNLQIILTKHNPTMSQSLTAGLICNGIPHSHQTKVPINFLLAIQRSYIHSL